MMQKHGKKIIAAVGAALGVAGTAAVFQANRTAVHTPAKLTLDNWKTAFTETFQAMGKKSIPLLGAGIAYFSTLSFFPLLAAAVSIAALVIAPEEISEVTKNLTTYLPSDIASLVSAQLTNLAGKSDTNLITAVVAIALSLFSASGAVKNLMTATNIIYQCKESRNFFVVQLTGLVFTLAALLMGFVIIGLIALNGSILGFFRVPEPIVTVALAFRWVVVVGIVTVGLSVFYRYGPSRPSAKWQWVSWGGALATLVWLIGTIAFFIYVQYFASFSESYSLVAGIVVLMIWLNLTAFIVLLGAQVNYSLESQTRGLTVKKGK